MSFAVRYPQNAFNLSFEGPSVQPFRGYCHGVWAGTLVPPTSMDSAKRTRLWVGSGLQWRPGTTTPKGATPLQPFLFFSFLLTLQFYVIATTAAQALSRVLFGCRDRYHCQSIWTLS